MFSSPPEAAEVVLRDRVITAEAVTTRYLVIMPAEAEAAKAVQALPAQAEQAVPAELEQTTAAYSVPV